MGHSRSLVRPLETAFCPDPDPGPARPELPVPRSSLLPGQLDPPHPGQASSVDLAAPLPRSHAQVREEVEGFPPPSCPLSPTTQVARAPPGPVRVEATRAPRGHLPWRLGVLWGGSQRPAGKGAGWGGAAVEDPEGWMAGASRDASRSLATPPRHVLVHQRRRSQPHSRRSSRVKVRV